MELTLTGVAHGGEAVGRAGDLVTFAAYGLPGERVEVEILEQKPRFSRGRVVEVLEPAPERVTAPCPIFGTCGGCHWQHASYAAQLAFKTAVLRDQLVRLGKFPEPPVEAAVPSPHEWHYRNTVQFVPAVAPDGVTRVLCFQRRYSHEPVPVEHCYIADPLIDRALHEVPWDTLSDSTWGNLDAIVVRVVPEQAVQITLVARAPLSARDLKRFGRVVTEQLPVVSGVLAAGERAGEPRLLAGDPALVYEFAGNRLEVPAGAFVQVNLGAAEVVLRQVEEWLAPSGDDVLLDAYAGTGAFALALAGRVAAVTAIESHRAAAEAGVRNAGANRRINVAFQAQSVERTLLRAGNRADLVVLDPPRRGCAPEVVDGIAALGPRRIAYVSCEPSTLARDLRRFCDQGYDLARTRVVDMFPQTFHLESVSLLEQR
jgi:23S rRNA (uracil1939-C5)-methyltransferase